MYLFKHLKVATHRVATTAAKYTLVRDVTKGCISRAVRTRNRLVEFLPHVQVCGIFSDPLGETISHPSAEKAGMERAQCIDRNRSLEADSQM